MFRILKKKKKTVRVFHLRSSSVGEQLPQIHTKRVEVVNVCYFDTLVLGQTPPWTSLHALQRSKKRKSLLFSSNEVPPPPLRPPPSKRHSSGWTVSCKLKLIFNSLKKKKNFAHFLFSCTFRCHKTSSSRGRLLCWLQPLNATSSSVLEPDEKQHAALLPYSKYVTPAVTVWLLLWSRIVTLTSDVKQTIYLLVPTGKKCWQPTCCQSAATPRIVVYEGFINIINLSI